MKKILLLLLVAPYLLLAGYTSSISKISPTVKKRMLKGNSWRKGCPVGIKDLRYLKIKHIGFNGKDKMGELIVHKNVAKEVTDIFGELYKSGYPIKKMRLVSDYKANDWQSIEADNTSAFNCRKATGSTGWSKHSYGKAIDINPIENPYIRKNGRISHKASYKFKKRKHINLKKASDRAMLIVGDKAVKIFSKYNWGWGYYFKGAKDIQHLYKK